MESSRRVLSTDLTFGESNFDILEERFSAQSAFFEGQLASARSDVKLDHGSPVVAHYDGSENQTLGTASIRSNAHCQ